MCPQTVSPPSHLTVSLTKVIREQLFLRLPSDLLKSSLVGQDLDCLAGSGQVCGASVSYQIPFTCSPHTTENSTTAWQSRDTIESGCGPHGHFAGGDLTDTPAPHQDAGGELFRAWQQFHVFKTKGSAKT